MVKQPWRLWVSQEYESKKNWLPNNNIEKYNFSCSDKGISEPLTPQMFTNCTSVDKVLLTICDDKALP